LLHVFYTGNSSSCIDALRGQSWSAPDGGFGDLRASEDPTNDIFLDIAGLFTGGAAPPSGSGHGPSRDALLRALAICDQVSPATVAGELT